MTSPVVAILFAHDIRPDALDEACWACTGGIFEPPPRYTRLFDRPSPPAY